MDSASRSLSLDAFASQGGRNIRSTSSAGSVRTPSANMISSATVPSVHHPAEQEFRRCAVGVRDPQGDEPPAMRNRNTPGISDTTEAKAKAAKAAQPSVIGVIDGADQQAGDERSRLDAGARRAISAQRAACASMPITMGIGSIATASRRTCHRRRRRRRRRGRHSRAAPGEAPKPAGRRPPSRQPEQQAGADRRG